MEMENNVLGIRTELVESFRERLFGYRVFIELFKF